MAKFEFPRNPGVGRENPFEGEDGRNPFSDDSPSGRHVAPLASVSESPSENVYAATDNHSVPAYRPGEYVTTLPHRSRRVLIYGTCGLAVSVLALGFCVLALASQATELTVISSVPLQLIALSLSIPAWLLGQSDLRAMKAGAMDASGRSGTRIGFTFGVTGTTLAVVAFALVVARLILAG